MIRLTHNLRIFIVGIFIVFIILAVRFNTQTASLTDVFSPEEQMSRVADIMYDTDDTSSSLSTLKQYTLSSGSTLRVNFFVTEEKQDAFQQSLTSSYGFFVTNHNTVSTVTIYLPESIEANVELLHSTMLPVLDTVILFHNDEIDSLRVEQNSSTTIHQ